MIKIRDLELLNNIDVIYKNKIILYGAGDYGCRALRLLRQLEIPVYSVSDSNKESWGRKIREHIILSIQDVVDICKEKQAVIIITISNVKCIIDVLRILEKAGVSGTKCYTYFALKTPVELHINDQRIKENYRHNYKIAKKMFSDYMLHDWENRAREFIFSFMRYETVLIWQPGKVGSSSIARSLEEARIHYIHLHCLAFGNWLRPEIHNSYGIQHYWQKKPIEKLNLFNSEKIKVISLVRDPVGRGVADYFEGLGTEYIKYDETDFNIYQHINDFLVKETEVGEYGYIFEWFNQEIKEFLGIDIYKYDFNRKKGYQIIRENNVEILLIKLERLNDCEDILGRFLELGEFKLLGENIGADKLYKFVYEEVKKTLKIPECVINFYYKNNKAMDHFYTEEEKLRFINKWSRN